MFEANNNIMATLSSRASCAGSSGKQRAAPNFNGNVEDVNWITFVMKSLLN
jgi:hypothetical protein